MIWYAREEMGNVKEVKGLHAKWQAVNKSGNEYDPLIPEMLIFYQLSHYC